MNGMFSAEEIAGLGIPGYPATARSIERRGQREGWRFTWRPAPGGPRGHTNHGNATK